MNDNYTDNIPINIETYFSKFHSRWWQEYTGLLQDDVKEQVKLIIKERISRVHSYVFDAKEETFKNLDESLVQYIKEFNILSQMTKKKILSNRTKSNLGVSCMVIIPSKVKPIIQVMQLLSKPKVVNGELVEVFVTLNDITKNNEENSLQYYRIYLTKNQKVKVDTIETIIGTSNSIDLKDGTITSTQKFDINFLPVEININNEDEKPDIEYAAAYIDLEGQFTQSYVKEWEYIKIILQQNLSFNPEPVEKMQKQIERKDGQDQRVLPIYDADGKFQNAISYLTNGGVTLDIAKMVADSFHSKVEDYALVISKMDGGNNKHTSEVIGANIHPLNYIWNRKTLYEEFLGRFYLKLLKIVKFYGYAKLPELPKYIELSVHLARPMEIILQLNADSSEQDARTQINIMEEKGEGKE